MHVKESLPGLTDETGLKQQSSKPNIPTNTISLNHSTKFGLKPIHTHIRTTLNQGHSRTTNSKQENQTTKTVNSTENTKKTHQTPIT